MEPATLVKKVQTRAKQRGPAARRTRGESGLVQRRQNFADDRPEPNEDKTTWLSA